MVNNKKTEPNRVTITVPRIVISSIKGKSGKTLAALTLIAAFSKAGYRVSVFKNGPDFIDPSYHSHVLGSPSRNIDYVLMGESVVERFYRYSSDSDIALVEGNHGLYDSIDGISESGSTAQMAKLLHAPVIIVLDGERANRTLGAIVKGLIYYDRNVKIIGIILTNIIPRQAERLRKVVEAEGLPTLGIIYRDEKISEATPYRHLGLMPMSERERFNMRSVIDEIALHSIKTDEIIKLARERSDDVECEVHQDLRTLQHKRVKFGIMTGKSFTFYYPETIEKAGEVGMVKFIDPETTQSLPDVDILLIGGGFPEIYSEALERNKSLRNDLRRFAEGGGMIYAECGGLMYLTNSIIYNNEQYEMVGVVDGDTVVTKKPMAHGHAIARVLRNIPIANAGDRLMGHEFHYSKILLRNKYDFALSYEKGKGISDGHDGIQIRNVYAQYMHIHPSTHDFVKKLSEKFLNKEMD